ncbi:phage holin family protein, partial [Enterorhabdus sp. NM05_H27]
MNFIIRWIVTAIAVAAAVWIVPGIDIISAD